MSWACRCGAGSLAEKHHAHVVVNTHTPDRQGSTAGACSLNSTYPKLNQEVSWIGSPYFWLTLICSLYFFYFFSFSLYFLYYFFNTSSTLNAKKLMSTSVIIFYLTSGNIVRIRQCLSLIPSVSAVFPFPCVSCLFLLVCPQGRGFQVLPTCLCTWRSST